MKTRISEPISVKTLCVTAMMIAMEIVLHRFLAYQGQSVQINIAFLPIALVAMLYGPAWSGAAWAIGDTLGTFIAGSGAWFPLFTVTNCVAGVIMGLFLYRRPVSLVRVIAMALTNALFCSLLMQTFFLTIYFNDWAMGFDAGAAAYFTRFGMRLVQNAVMVPVQVALVYAAGRFMARRPLSTT